MLYQIYKTEHKTINPKYIYTNTVVFVWLNHTQFKKS